jgi:type I restriction enzyme, S subunit
MKDSGIEWLGEIPEHWEMIQLRRFATRIKTGTTPPTAEERFYEDGTVDWFGPGSFGESITLTKPVKFIHQPAIDERAARLFLSGAITKR